MTPEEALSRSLSIGLDLIHKAAEKVYTLQRYSIVKQVVRVRASSFEDALEALGAGDTISDEATTERAGDWCEDVGDFLLDIRKEPI